MSDISTLGLAIGAGLATLGVSGPAMAVSNVAAKFLEGSARQPEHAQSMFVNAIIFAALSEALGILAWLLAFFLYQGIAAH